jgi:putative chitinase
MNWQEVLTKISPRGNASVIKGFAESMPQVIKLANLTTSDRLAQFLAQVAHESDGFRTTVEYASGKAYNGRADLGNRPGTNDGVTYKGRGLIQLTGRANYTDMSKKLGVDFVGNPRLAAQFPWAALIAAQFWRDRNLNALADIGDINAITKRINGGYNGLADRKKYLNIARAEVSDIKLAQRRLTQLNYPPGGIDGVSGPLTRSALRDFQDAAGLKTTGILDGDTKKALFADNAPARPVSQERKALGVKDLIEKGSEVVEGTQEAKKGIIGAGLATAATAVSEVREMSSQVTEISEGLRHGASIWEIAKDYWYVFAIAILCLVVCFLLWRAYRGAKKAQDSRVNAARNGTNVRV